ncbi:hypothetical protein [Nonomuraea basaltis]|uniref:hypothetical protein n=1 Tax=Nonomuraea basaltis TaxID=2495887 RepID=UPI00110C459A|nr:hypothetical protein [Nonomuraea basaltis]TMR99564.1 hypothetical protein EJK15_07055 [Nonomuraea basaltis]
MRSGLGIGAIGEQLYRHLVEQGPTPTNELERVIGNGSGDALARLRDVGLVVGEPAAARHPDYALRPLVANAEAVVTRLKTQAAEMRDLFDSSAAGMRGPNTPVEVLTARQRIAAAFDDLSLGAHIEVLQFVTWPFVPLTAVHGPGDPARRNPDGSVRRPRRRLLFEHSVLESEAALIGLHNAITLGADVRLAKELPFKLIVSDRERALVPRFPRDFSDQASTLLLRGGALVECMLVMFEHFWSEATPLEADYDGFGPGAAREIDEQDMAILQHIIAGQTDDSMAKLMGTSKSTILRRVKRMRELAGVETRPALIFHAARNWMN